MSDFLSSYCDIFDFLQTGSPLLCQFGFTQRRQVNKRKEMLWLVQIINLANWLLAVFV